MEVPLVESAIQHTAELCVDVPVSLMRFGRVACVWI